LRFSSQMFKAGRRAMMLSAALACACALLAALVADANASTTITAHPSAGKPAALVKKPKAPARAKGKAVAAGLFDRSVSFRNSYGKTVWVAIMRYNPDSCGGYGDWETAGWWQIAPGEVKEVFRTSNRYAYYYAKAADGATWGGTYGPVYLYHDAFDSCLNIGSSAAYDRVGMRQTDLGLSWSHTVNLIP
jgi:uncharacterized membrane protein